MMSQHLPNWMAMISVREAKCDISRDISSIIHTHSARCIRAAPRSTLHPTNHNMTPEVDTKKVSKVFVFKRHLSMVQVGYLFQVTDHRVCGP